MKKIISACALLCITIITQTQYLQAQCNGNAPIINSFSPNTGFIGSTVTIVGANFDATPANNQVFFGATKATVLTASFGVITVTVPVGASTAPIAVKNGCNLIAYSAVSFNGIFCPTPITASTYNNTAFTLTGIYGAYNMLAQDLDMDGKADVVSSANSGNLSVARNVSTPGNLNFTAHNFPSWGGQSVSTADFDGDGLRDLFTVQRVLRNISSGIGNINFSNTGYSFSGYQGSVGDFNNDGRVDLVYENGGGTMYFYRNTSTGPGMISFVFSHSVNVTHRSTGIQCADVDGDGKTDVLSTQGNGNRLIALRNTTTPGASTFSFAAVQDFNSGGLYPYRCQIADFDKDGKIDLATVNYNSAVNTVNTAIFRNTSSVGAISFAVPATYSGPNSNYRIGVGDVNGDGLPDIVTKSLAVQAYAVYPNTSTGPGNIAFAPRFDYPSAAAAEVSGIVIGDLDGDYVPDIATSGVNSNTIRFHRNTSSQSDNTAPTAICKDIIVALSPSGTVTVTPQMIDNGSSDACGIGSLQINNSASVTFTCANLGDNVVTLTVTDVAGNVSTCTATINVAPAAIIVAGQTTVCQGQTVSMSANPGDSYQWYKDAVPIPGATSQTYVANTSGNYVVAVTNAGGCSGVSAPTSITVNNNPTVAVTPAGPASLCPPSSTLLLTASTSSIYQWKLNGNDIAGATQQQYTATAAGGYSVQVVDLFGCTATSAVVNVSATDNIPPTAIAQNLTIALDGSGQATITAAQVNNGSFDNCGIASMTVSPSSFNCSHVGGSATNCPADVQYNDNATNANSGPNGQTFIPMATGKLERIDVISFNPVQLRVRDYVSTNLATAFTGNILATSNSANGAGNFPGFTSFYFTNPPTLTAGQTYIFEVVGSGTVYHHIPGGYANGTAVSPTNPTFVRDIPFRLYICPDGHPVTLTVTDVAGNTASAVARITVVDQTPPVVTCPQPVTVQCAGQVPPPNVASVTVSDNCSATVTWISDVVSNQVAPNKYTITRTYRATDPSGNFANCTQLITVDDVTPPVITAPPNVSVGMNPGSCFATGVNLGTPIFSDNCPGVMISNNAPAQFAPGITGVLWTATDASGNTATALQNVLVSDNQPPTISCSPAITQNVNAGCGAVIAVPAPGFNDNCSVVELTWTMTGATVANSPASGMNYVGTINFNVGTTTITYTVKDKPGVGNAASCSQTITVVDNVPPVISCPFNIVVNAAPGSCGAVVNYNPPSATDNCGQGNLPTSLPGFTYKGTFGGHTYFVSNSQALPEDAHATAISLGGHLATIGSAAENAFVSAMHPDRMWIGFTDRDVEGTYRWVTNEPITYTNWDSGEPNNCCGGPGEDWAVINWTGPTWNDWFYSQPAFYVVEFEGGAIPVTHVSGPASGSVFPTGVTTVTYSATDPSGNSVSCSFTVTVIDNQPPVVQCPGNQSINLDANCSAVLPDYRSLLTATDNCTAAGSLVVTQSPAPGTVISQTGNMTVSFTVTDAAGNSASCNMTVAKNDVTPPAITCPASVVVNNDAGVCGAVVQYNKPLVTDNCSSGGSGQGYTITSTTYAPFDMTGSTYIGGCDDCQFGPVTLPFSFDYYGTPYNQVFVYPSTNGFISFQYTGSGCCSGQPLPNAWYPNTIFAAWSDWVSSVQYKLIGTAPNRIAVFNIAGGSYSGGGSVSTQIALYETTNQVQIIHTNVSNTTYYRTQGLNKDGSTATIVPGRNGTYGWTAYNESLMFTPASTVTLVQTAGLPSGSVFPVGTTTNTFVATDGSGNQSTCSFTVTVNDTEAPQLLGVPPSTTVECTNVPAAAAVTAADNCPGVGQVQYSEVKTDGNCAGNYTLTRTWSVTDAHNNTQSATQVVTVQDTQAPVFGNAAANLTVECDGNGNTQQLNDWLASNGGATASDACGSVTWSHNFTGLSDACGATGSATVIFTATDDCGNSSSVTATFTIVDNTPPAISCPADVTVNCDDSKAPAATGTASASDICGFAAISFSDVSSQHPDANNAGHYNYTITRTWTATDDCGNTSSCTQVITVQDITAPVAVCKPVTITLVNGAASITTADVNNGSTDNCSPMTYTVSKSSFSCADIGPNTVTLTVTDVCGNASTCQAVVTVIGEIPTCSIASVPSNSVYTGGVSTNLYLGYGPQSTTLQLSVPASGAPYTFSWSGNGVLSSYNVQSPVFAPSSAGVYTFTVFITNKYGCTTTCSITICVMDIRVMPANGPWDGKKVYVCHVPPGNPANAHTIEVSVNAVPAHVGPLGHATDRLGKCDQAPCGSLIARPITVAPVKEKPAEFTVRLTPNPSNSQFSLLVSSGDKQTPVVIRVMDALGRLVEMRKVMEGDVERFGRNYTSGTYFIEVVQGQQKKIVQGIKAD